jgi:hypothetical protein
MLVAFFRGGVGHASRWAKEIALVWVDSFTGTSADSVAMPLRSVLALRRVDSFVRATSARIVAVLWSFWFPSIHRLLMKTACNPVPFRCAPNVIQTRFHRGRTTAHALNVASRWMKQTSESGIERHDAAQHSIAAEARWARLR